MPKEIVTMFVEKKSAVKRENGLAVEDLLFAKKGGKGGKGGKGAKGPKKNERENNKKQMDQWK